MKVLPLTADQDRQLQAWRAIALEEMPYFAHIMFNVRPLNAPGLGTWAVDAQWRLYIDFEACTRDRSFLWNVESVLHEASHLYAEDATSAQEMGVTDATRKVWNVATDLARNDDLDAAGCRTFRQDKMLPEFIGEENGKTPHHYFAVLQQKMAAKAARTTKPTMRLRPGTVAVGAVSGTRVTATIEPAVLDPNDFTLTLLDAEDQPVGIHQVTTRGAAALTFEVFDDLPAGTYTALLVTGTHTMEATLTVAEPSIAVIPDHVASGWTAPLPLRIAGRFTSFDASVSITVTAPDGREVATSALACQSSTDVTFKIAQQVPDGVYTITVHDHGNDLVAHLPIGLPHLDIAPAHLPVDFDSPHPLAATVTDLPLDSATTFEVSPLMAPVPLPGRIRNVAVKSGHYAQMELGSLPEGTYVVTATTPTPEGPVAASALLTVSDETGDGAQGEGGGGTGGDIPGDGDPFKGCGSGSGGEAWSGELPPDDDLDGAAPPITPIEKESVRLNTAAAIKDFAAKGRGTVPGGLVAIADKILEPSTTPWEQVLAAGMRQLVRRSRGSSYVDYCRPNRRRSGQMLMTPSGPRAMFVPGRSTPKPLIEMIRDTSGSMGAVDLAVVTREAVGIAKRMGVRGDDFMITDVDAAVHGTKKFRGRASIAEVKGRGGTSMTVGIEAAWARKKNRATALVVATDGGTDWPEEPGPIPVIAALIPPYGLNSEEYMEHIVSMVPDWIKVVVCEPGKIAA